MTTRDAYVALLEKRATSEGDVLHESIPPNDSYDAANQEHRKNQEDHRTYLHSVFSNAEAVQTNQSAEVKKLFNNIPSGASTSNPLLKVARAPFFAALEAHGNFVKSASPIHREVVFSAFCDELEKIAAFAAAKSLPNVSRGVVGLGTHPTQGTPAITGAFGVHPSRMPVSHSNPNPIGGTARPMPQTSLGVGAVSQ